MIINDLDDYYIVFDTKNRNIELDTLNNKTTKQQDNKTTRQQNNNTTKSVWKTVPFSIRKKKQQIKIRLKK